MKFTNIRLVGFKSFVEPTDFEIRDGLTGVVGPNGCGKSNVLEALRWVMGATSAKALRGAAMDAVIFSGTSMRPARNWAEVVLTLDNSDRSAPAEYNEAATLEVSRRIIRKEDGAHSVYRINNKEVRAKDVQLLFADASTGANSPALVRQGQVGDLINAKPQNRRRLLEEAAGVTGLHSRRHEAELRLRAAEQNLERLDDVMGELEAQKGALARQARQATRYRNVSGDIRRSEAMLAHLRWREATDALSDASTGLEEIGGRIAETASAAAAASTQQEDAHSALDPLRMREAEDAAALHRLNVARDGLDDEARRAAAEIDRLTSEISRLGGDRDREHDLLADADNAIAALSQEEETLKAREASEAERLTAAAAHMQEASDALDQAERAFEAQSSEAADIDAKRRAIADAIAGAERRLTKINSQIQDLSEERDLITPSPEEAAALEAAKARFEAVSNAAQHAEAAFQRAEDEKRAAEQRESELRGPLRQAEQTQTEIDAERDALRRVLAADGADDWRPLLEMVSVEAGYESALAAALGDDLSASTDEAAPARWTRLGDAAIDLPLPFGAEPLSRFVRAPAQLTRRLASVGVIAAEDGARLSASLKPGQRLVSTAGDVWRWDGFAAKADAKTAAAVRLEQRNRLIVLERDHEDTVARARAAAQAHESAVAALKTTQDNERAARAAFVDAGRAVDKARTALSELEREHERASTRRGAIEDHLARLTEDQAETQRMGETQEAQSAALPDAAVLAARVSAARETLSQARAKASETRGLQNDLTREATLRADRLAELARERGGWTSRGDTARGRISEFETRIGAASESLKTAEGAPAAIEEKRKRLLDEIGAAETRRQAAADALAEGQQRALEADKTAKQADEAAAEAREARARLEAQSEAAQARVDEAVAQARETCDAAPDALLAIAEHKPDAELPAREDVERKLERYKRERENLGGVNLRADEELKEIAVRLEELTVEREDCDGAIRKLRSAIASLNREARQRLLDAFETVNTNFQDLFKRLFNGGQAELRLIDSEDPLEAGLEVMASPPGKKLASMSLMSGGEQALTAISLIFAVFMANPAPVCVLDEVDAPLDDTNVDRFCRLLHEMAHETDTRFIIVTHHALSMSRMDRLYGVTMIERGVSQLVSVDLSKAEQLAAAE